MGAWLLRLSEGEKVVMTTKQREHSYAANNGQATEVASPRAARKAVQPKMRINVNLSEDSYHTLQDQASDHGVDMSEFVRSALRVYTTLLNEQKDGKRIYVGTNDRVEKELILP
jgi:predicted DNA binding CopG/RHH family protein